MTICSTNVCDVFLLEKSDHTLRLKGSVNEEGSTLLGMTTVSAVILKLTLT